MSGDYYFLYPRLPHPTALMLAESHIRASVMEITEQINFSYEGVYFAPTGGNKISEDGLKELRAEVISIAKEKNFPNPPNTEAARSFDLESTLILYKKMRLHPSEASHNEVWSFLGCVLLPDVVRWRFSFSSEVVRYVARERGMRRHAFGRLWWRAYISYNPKCEKDPFFILRALNEDELVAVTERPSIASRPMLFRSFCNSFLTSVQSNNALGRRELIREASKQMFRQLSLIQVEALSEKELEQLTDSVFSKTIERLLKPASNH